MSWCGILGLMEVRDEELYSKHADELVRFATTLIGPSLAEDVVANAVVRSMTSSAWLTVSEPRAYLFRAVLNEAMTVTRSSRRRGRREAFAAPRELDDQSSISIEVRDAMNRLSLTERSALFLAYWHDLSVEEIAQTLNLSRRTTERGSHPSASQIGGTTLMTHTTSSPKIARAMHEFSNAAPPAPTVSSLRDRQASSSDTHSPKETLVTYTNDDSPDCQQGPTNHAWNRRGTDRGCGRDGSRHKPEQRGHQYRR